MTPAHTMDPAAIHDPFAEHGETQHGFMRPNPGGRIGTTSPAIDALAAAPLQAAPDLAWPEHGLNPLLALANRLLVAVPSLRATQQVADPAALRDALAQGIRDFAARAAAQGIAPEQVMAARYVLCTLLDEAASDTPWGGAGVWAAHSLAAMFHNDTKGGDKVFQLMARLAERPDAHRDVLELVYAALTLGFEGRYRVQANGRAQLEAVRDKLAQILRQQRGDHPREFAQHWQGQGARRRAALGWLPLAAAAAVSALLLTGTYLALLFSLAARTEPVYAQVQALRLPSPVVVAAQPAPRPRVAQFLAPDVKARTLTVSDELDRSLITLRGDGAFAPGSATLLPAHQALIGRIAEALTKVPGSVLVTGHTDNQPIARSARFPSNWHLSQERARSVQELLIAGRVAPDRIRAEGRADSEPLVANDSAGNRALNRRVEITLFAGRAGAAEAPRAAGDAKPAVAGAVR